MPIFDQGYQHWDGALAPRAWRFWAVTRQGIRAQLRNRRTKFFVLGAWVPGLFLVAFLALWGLFEQKAAIVEQFQFLFMLLPQEIRDAPREFRPVVWTVAFHVFLWMEVTASLLLVLMVGPDLISQDLRFNAFPLYLSRPLQRLDYFAGKLGVIVAFIGSLTVLPAVLAYVVGVAFSLDFTVVRDTWRILVASVGYGLMVAAACGVIMLAFSSLTRNSHLVAMMWCGLWIVSGMLSEALVATLNRGDDQKTWAVVSFPSNLHRLREVMLDTQSARDKIDRLVQKAAEMAEAAERMAAMQQSRGGVARMFGPREQGLAKAPVRVAEPPPEEDDSPRARRRRRRDEPWWNSLVSPYPWTYSAAVLAGLCGVSTWILSTRVKSLDRLR